MPAANPAVTNESSKLDGAVPEVADRVTHDWVLAAVQVSVPLPVFVMVMFCELGFGPRAVPDGFTPVAKTSSY